MDEPSKTTSTGQLLQAMDEQGFVIIPRIFSALEIARIVEDLENSFRSQP